MPIQSGPDYRRIRAALRWVTNNPWSGNHYFVGSAHSGAGTSSGHGYSPDAPLTTLNAAVALCTADNCDTIHVLPGHAETIDSAADVDLSTAGVRVIGYGIGSLRPTFTFSTTADGTFAVGASNLWIENLLFIANFTNGVTVGMDIDDAHTDVMVKDCEFRAAAATKEFLIAVTIAASAARIVFDGCYFNELAGDASAAIASEGALTDLTVKNCLFHGTYSAATLDLDAGSNAVVTPRIINNISYNSNTAAGLFCSIDSGVVGLFIGNQSGIGKANTVPITDGSASVFVNNRATDAANLASLEYPATATAWS